MSAFENLLEWINEKFGAVGSVVSILFWLVVLVIAIRGMLP